MLVNSNTTDEEESSSVVPGNPADDIIYGIASFGLKECGETEQFSLYTIVSQYADWIDTTINNFTPFEENSLPSAQVRPFLTHLGANSLCLAVRRRRWR